MAIFATMRSSRDLGARAAPSFGGQYDRLNQRRVLIELLARFDIGQRVSKTSADGVNAAFRDAAI